MPRVTKSVTAKAKHKKVLSATKGHYGARSRLFRTAKQSNIKSLQYAFRDRKNRKRAFRSLWIARINAGSRALGVSYSKLINGLASKNIKLEFLSQPIGDEPNALAIAEFQDLKSNQKVRVNIKNRKRNMSQTDLKKVWKLLEY